MRLVLAALVLILAITACSMDADLTGIHKVNLGKDTNTGFGVTIVPHLEYTWTAPTTGTEVVYYQVEVDYGGEENDLFIDFVHANTVIVYTREADCVRIRVRGVDAADKIGPWSDYSIPYCLPDEIKEVDAIIHRSTLQ